MKFAVFIVCVFISFLGLSGGYTISTFDYSWVTSSYPTAYQTGSFSLNGTDINSFEKNKSNKTFEITLPTGFEFNTASASSSVTSTGNGNVTGVSFVFTSPTVVTVTYSTLNSDLQDTLFFNDFEIRATAQGSGTLIRTGGDARLRATTGGPTSGAPTSLEPFGTFSAFPQMEYTSSTSSHVDVSDVTQYSINNEILQIEIVTTNAGNPIRLTSINLNTDGNNGTGCDDPANDLSNAKIFYTGNSNTFSTSNLFGSLGSTPSGSFSINGSYELSEGSNFFWLTYDITGDANTTHSIDASIESVVIDGSTHTDQTINSPSGKRDIAPATFYYAIASGNWTSTSIWSETDNGTTCNCAPNGSGIVVIDTNYSVTLSGDRTVDVVQIEEGASLYGTKSLTANTAITVNGTGFFSFTDDIYCLGNISLNGIGSSDISTEFDIEGDLIIASGATLTHSGNGAGSGDGRNLLVAGNLEVEGTLSLTGGGDLILNGGTSSISGTGSIINSQASTDVKINNGHKNILSGSNLTVGPSISIEGAYTVSNFGVITAQGDISSSSNSASWKQEASSTLNIQGSLMSNSNLDASSNGNLINYYLAGAQDIVIPINSYYNLYVNGSGTKSLAGDIAVQGSMLIGSVASMDIGNNTVTLTGSLAVNGTLQADQGTFVFDGSTTIAGSGTPNFGNVNITNGLTSSSGTINVAGNFTNSGTFNHGNGTVNFNGTSSISGSSITFNNISINGNVTAPSSMSIEGTWTDNGTFTHNSGIVSFSGSNQQNLGGTSNTTFYQFNMNNTAGAVLATSIAIDQNLSISNGNIDLNSNNITFASTASLSGENNDNRVYGSSGELVINLSINAPNSLDVGGFGVLLTGADNLGATTIRRGHTPQTGGGNSSIQRYYDISPTNNSGLNITLEFNYLENELNGQLENELALYRSTDGGTTWNNRLGTLNTTSNKITLSGIDAFSKWTASNSSTNPLPVELISYKGSYKDGEVLLTWVTASETNCAYYELNKSADHEPFNYLDMVYGSGTTTDFNEYEYVDTDINGKVLVYKLDEYDYDGTQQDCGSVSVVCDQEFNQNFEFYTDNNSIYLTTIEGFNKGFEVSLIDVNGRVIFFQKIYDEDTKQFVIHFPTDLSSGIYFLSLASPDGIVSKKFTEN